MIGISREDIILIPLPGTEWMAETIKKYILDIDSNVNCDLIEVEIIRFSSGDAKAVLQDSVRGKDVFVLVDVGNYDCKYIAHRRENYYSPDEHFQNLIRTISALGGKASRVNVIMPLLYASRQDRRSSRESLDCAIALQQLERLGVKNIVTFDVHDDRVQNAIPNIGFDNLMPIYQVIKTMCRHYSDLCFTSNGMTAVSPDMGGANRAYIYADILGIDFGLFYKRRDLNNVINGSNPIIDHKYIGPELAGRDVLIVDDIIASGESVFETVRHVKAMGAKRVFIAATFCFFSNGIQKFDSEYENEQFDALFISNASYCGSDVRKTSWFKEVNVVKYISLYAYSVSIGYSLAGILDPRKKIADLLIKYYTTEAN